VIPVFRQGSAEPNAAIADRAVWRDDERRWLREGKDIQTALVGVNEEGMVSL